MHVTTIFFSSRSLSLSIRSISGWHNKISLLIKCANECEWTWTIHSLSSPVFYMDKPRCLVYPYKIKSDLLQRIHLLLYSYTNQLVIMVGFVILLRLKVLGKRKSWAVPNYPFFIFFFKFVELIWENGKKDMHLYLDW